MLIPRSCCLQQAVVLGHVQGNKFPGRRCGGWIGTAVLPPVGAAFVRKNVMRSTRNERRGWRSCDHVMWGGQVMPIINISMNAFTCRLWQSHRRMPQEENYKSCYTLTMTLSIGIVLVPPDSSPGSSFVLSCRLATSFDFWVLSWVLICKPMNERHVAFQSRVKLWLESPKFVEKPTHTWPFVFQDASLSLPTLMRRIEPQSLPPPEQSPDGWISRKGPGGRIFWHHKALGPAPWEQQVPTSLTRNKAFFRSIMGKVADLTDTPLSSEILWLVTLWAPIGKDALRRHFEVLMSTGCLYQASTLNLEF